MEIRRLPDGMEEVSDVAGSICPACSAEFESQETLDHHARTEHQQRSTKGGGFRCPACGAEFESQESLDAHTRQQHAA